MVRWVDDLRRAMAGLAKTGRNLLLPPRCLSCSQELSEWVGDLLFCPKCLEHFGPETWWGCRRCAALVVNQGFFTDSCPFCQRLALKFDAAVTLGGYHQGLRDIVLRMKRPTHDALTVAMGRLLYQRRCREFSNYPLDMVVPIPMYWWRRLRRGANNPDVLARCLGESLAIPVHRRLLVRHVNTKPQADLPRSQRLVNVRGAFRLRNPDRVQNANILLVDDVLTTGATCSEAAKILKQAGAASVVVAVIARTQRE